MKTLSRLFHRLRFALFGRDKDGDLAEEFDCHIRMQAEENMRAGMTAAEARRSALLKFGSLDAVKESYRDQRSLPLLDTLHSDFRFALRLLVKSPGFAAVAVTMLALGIGVNAAVFAVTNAVLFKGFPQVERSDRLLYIANGYGCCVSYPDFEDWRAQAKSFDRMAILHGTGVVLSDSNGFAERYDATEVSSDTFKVAGRSPLLGRDFQPADELPGATPVVILRYEFWERRFGKDPSIVGRAVRINGVPTTVIGVMPEGFSFPQNQELWVPLVPTVDVEKRERRNLWCVVGRMADGATVESARAEMQVIGRRLATAYPVTNQDQVPVVQTFDEFFVGPNATKIYGSMWGAVGFVLLIACANLANLLLSRAIGRTREISVRIALGAGRWRIIRQLLIESMMISAAGGSLGWWIARWSVRAYELAGRAWRVLDYAMDYRVLAYLIGISIVTGLLFGLVPAMRLSRLEVNAALKDAGHGAMAGRRGRQLSSILVTAEMALAVVLLAGAGVLVHSLLKLMMADKGLRVTNVLTLGLSLPSDKYPTSETQISFFDSLKARLEAVPGVESVAYGTPLPGQRAARFPYEFADSSPVEVEQRPLLWALTVSPAYFRTLGGAVLAGREFNDSDGVSGIPVVVVNQRFAKEYWPGENPLGKRLRLFKGTAPQAWLTVVGVVSNIVQNSATMQDLVDPLVYLPYRENPTSGMWVFARTRVPSESVGLVFRSEIRSLDSDLPINNLMTLDYWFKWGYLDSSIVTAMFLIFAAIALLLASFGLYAVMAHLVSQRTQEIGVRMAIGATAGDILKLVLRQGLLPLGVGLTIGLVASFAVNPILKSVLIEVSPADPVAFALAAGVLVLSALVGCWIPARRALRVDPVVALRHE